MTQIALFGTSADPPTVGHQAILQWLGDRYDRVAVWAADNPFKSHQASLEHRQAMLRLSIDAAGKSRSQIRLYPELSHPRTLETVQKARQLWGDCPQLTLAIGADLISQMPRWYRIEELLQQVKLLVVPRPGYSRHPESLTPLQQLGGNCEIADFTPPDVSSTAYRDRNNPEAIAPAVANYIHQHHLYAWQQAVQTQSIPDN